MDNSSGNERLSEREEAILRALVYEYITTGKPVGSRSFVNKYSFSISPATMRNVMSDLESMDFLMQPHTSAGRIPTDKGYRFYVDSLLEKYQYQNIEDIELKDDVTKREFHLDKIFLSITKMLSQVSKYACVMITPSSDFAVVKRIELVLIDNKEILLILVTRTGMIINRKIVISEITTQDDLYVYSKYLTSELCGYTLNQIRDKLFEFLRTESQKTGRAIALDIAELALNNNEESELYLDGIENLLKIPEMVEEERLHSLLSIIEEKNILREILENSYGIEGLNTFIGEEIQDARVNGCSLVTTAYKIGNRQVGVIGVIGPTRMDYEKVVPLVDYTGKVVSKLLTSMSK